MLHAVRVLIADDEPFIAYDLATAVEDAHGEVIGPCGSLREAFALLGSLEPPAAAILDFNLSDGEVTPLAEHLLTRSVHVIMHSGVVIPDSFLTRHGAIVFCPKPTSSGRLVLRLRQMIDARAAGEKKANH